MRETSMQAHVLRDYLTQYTNPIRFVVGEIVTVGKRDTEWPDFVWTTTTDGNTGWAPIDWLQPLGGGHASAVRDYSARELDADTGDSVTLLQTLGGWWWCRRGDGREGWIPETYLEHA